MKNPRAWPTHVIIIFFEYIRQIRLLFLVLSKRGLKFQVNNSIIDGSVFHFRCLDRSCSLNICRPSGGTLRINLESWGPILPLGGHHWPLGQINARILFSRRPWCVLHFISKNDNLRLERGQPALLLDPSEDAKKRSPHFKPSRHRWWVFTVRPRIIISS